jgi:transposase
MSRVEVLSGPERRRRWSTEQKRSIRGGVCAGRFGSRGGAAAGCGSGQIYRWRRDLRSDATEFAEVMVAPDRSERSGTDVAALTIELGRDIPCSLRRRRRRHW